MKSKDELLKEYRDNGIHKRVLLILFAMLSFCSCSIDLETSDNGDLDGYWHMQSVDSLENGNRLDYSDNIMFWAVQVRLIEVRDRSDVLGAYLLQFNHIGDSLFLSNPRKNDKNTGDPVVEDVDKLRPFGINELGEHFKIEQLTSSKMVLKSKTLRISFKKF